MKIELPEQLDLSNLKNNILSFEIFDKFYSFSLYNPIEDGSFFYHEIERETHGDAFSSFKSFFYDNEFLSESFRQVFVVNNTSTFTFIPENISDEKDKEEFLKFNFFDNTDKILVQKINKPELSILHGINEDVFEFFNRTFSDLKFIHHLSPTLFYFVEKCRMGNNTKLVVNLQNAGLDILCFTPSGDFVFANHLKYNHLNDALYYIFFLWKQFNLNQLKDFIYIVGNSVQKPELIKQVQKYVHNVFPINLTPKEHFSGINLQNIPFELLSLTLCEL